MTKEQKKTICEMLDNARDLPKRFSQDEDEIIMKYIQTKGPSAVARALHRSRRSIDDRYSSLKLRKENIC